jgi:membrane protease YdiL (CAAX protease family)
LPVKPNEDNVKRNIRAILLVIATVFVGSTLLIELIGNGSIAKSTAQIDVDRCELMLRINDSLQSMGNLLIGPKGVEASGENSKQLVKQTLPLLVAAEKQNPKDPIILAKTLIVSKYLGEPISEILVKLNALSSDKGKELAHTLSLVYGKNPIASEDVEPLRDSIERLLPQSWYSDQARLYLYKQGQNQTLYEKLADELTIRSFALSAKIFALTALGALFLVGGIAVILVQIFATAKPLTPEAELAEIRAPADYGRLTVYAVFLAWLTTQIVIGILAHPFVKGLTQGQLGVTGTAMVMASIYLVSNGPGMVYIYFFALRPNHLQFLSALKIRLHYDKRGPGGMILAGVLAWMAAIPLMAVSYYIATQFFGSEGSSNPIIAIVTEAARHENFSATLLFYITLGVLAPICEEALFRGFLYTYLRRHWGVLPAIFTSSALFSLAHLDPGGSLPLFCLGSIFAYVAERTKSIVPAMIAHGLWNSSTFTLVIILFGS